MDGSSATELTKAEVTSLQAPGSMPLQPVSESAQLMMVIARAASDPSVDIEKMERLLSMQERMSDKEAKTAYSQSMNALQKELPRVLRTKKIEHNEKLISTYASWEEIDEVIRPSLSKHGFALTFRVETLDERPAVTAVLSHEQGHEERTGFKLPLDAGGAKNNLQAYGSTITYGKRYTACALLNIITEDDDTDGNEPPFNVDQLKDKIQQVSADGYDALRKEVVGLREKMSNEDFAAITTLMIEKRAELGIEK